MNNFNSHLRLIFSFSMIVATISFLSMSCSNWNSGENNSRFNVSEFSTPEICANCHPEHYYEWQNSSHATAITNPIFIAMHELAQEETDGELDQDCVKCHSPIASGGGETPPFYNNEELSSISLAGISCDFCHSITSITGSGQANFTFEPSSSNTGPLFDVIPNNFHLSTGNLVFDRSEFCGPCHDLINNHGVLIGRTNSEWNDSQYSSMIISCQDCHMKPYDDPRPIAVDGPERNNVHRHDFGRVNTQLNDSSATSNGRELTNEILSEVVDLHVTGPDNIDLDEIYNLSITVFNEAVGHNIPTGSIYDKQMWLEVIVIDNNGQQIYSSGTLDANNDLMDKYSTDNPEGDPDLVNFNGLLLDENGTEVHFLWQAFSIIDRSIPSLTSKEELYSFTIPVSISSPLTVSVRLLYRAFPPYLLRILGLEELVDQFEVYVMAEETKIIGVE